jgi:transketolase
MGTSGLWSIIRKKTRRRVVSLPCWELFEAEDARSELAENSGQWGVVRSVKTDDKGRFALADILASRR